MILILKNAEKLLKKHKIVIVIYLNLLASTLYKQHAIGISNAIMLRLELVRIF